jgi:ribosomal protein S18 acetylase RimI-like enzyme
MTADIRFTPLPPERYPDAAQALARAFFDNPAMMYVVPDDEGRRRALPWFFGRALRVAQLYGEAQTTPDGVHGAAIWLPPGDTIITPWRIVRSGMIMAPFKFGLPAFRRFMLVMNRFEDWHKRDMPPEHWYLMVLGVEPERQGQGMGSALISPGLARADRERLPCYLETDKEINVTFYRKHGFEVVVEEELPDGPRVWTMRREPVG